MVSQDSLLRETSMWMLFGIFGLILLTLFLLGSIYDEQYEKAYVNFSKLSCNQEKSILASSQYDHSLMLQSDIQKIYLVKCT